MKTSINIGRKLWGENMSRNTEVSKWFELFSDDIFNYLVYRMGSIDVDDIVQEVFIRAIINFESYQGNSSPKTWLMRIARNAMIDEIRRINRPKWKNIISLERSPEPVERSTPEEALEMNEVTKDLYLVIQSLKDNYRDVVVLRGIEGLCTKDTALILDWSESKVRLTYHRACRTLKKKLGRESFER